APALVTAIAVLTADSRVSGGVLVQGTPEARVAFAVHTIEGALSGTVFHRSRLARMKPPAAGSALIFNRAVHHRTTTRCTAVGIGRFVATGRGSLFVHSGPFLAGLRIVIALADALAVAVAIVGAVGGFIFIT